MSDDVYNMRGTIVLGEVLSVDDTGPAQTLTVRTHDGIVRSGIRVMQPDGHAGVTAGDGAEVLMFAVGGDPAHFVALPPSNPAARFGHAAAGEQVIYAPDGTRVAVRSGGRIEIWGGSSVTIHTAGMTVTAPSGVTIVGPLHVTGPVTRDADVSDRSGSLNRLRTNYDAHRHAGGPLTDHTD